MLIISLLMKILKPFQKQLEKNNRVALGIINQGFAKKIKELIGG